MNRCRLRPFIFVSAVLVTLSVLPSCKYQHDPIKSRVPDHKIDEAKDWKAPFGDTSTASPEIVAEGKELFEGKGNCYMCHGKSGKGDGPAAAKLHPHPPRDFTNCQFHEARTDGELFWVMKNGSAGTGMVAHIPWKISEEQGWKIVAYLRSFCEFS
jgi:cytochrome c